MQPLVVEPADVFDGRELELRARAPHAVCDQLGLVGVHEDFGHGVVQRVSDGPDRREHLMVVEHLGVVRTVYWRAGVRMGHQLEVRAGLPSPSAIRSASSTSSVRMLAASCQPTIILENTSSMNAK